MTGLANMMVDSFSFRFCTGLVNVLCYNLGFTNIVTQDGNGTGPSVFLNMS